MQVHEHLSPKFMANFARREPVVQDSTAVMLFKTCPKKYFFRIVLGFVPDGDRPVYFRFGSAYHKFREKLEHYVSAGMSEAESFIKAMEDAAFLFKKEGGNPAPTDKFAFQTEGRLLQSCEFGFKYWLRERRDGAIKVIAVPEQPFSLELDKDIVIGGRTDQLVEWRADPWVRDFKSTSKKLAFWKRGTDPNDQGKRYVWGAGKLFNKQVKGILFEALYNEAKAGPEIESFNIEYNSRQMETWIRSQRYWSDQIKKCRDEDIWPMNEKHCVFCEYHSVCTRSSETGEMSQLKTFYKLSYWDCSRTEQVDE